MRVSRSLFFILFGVFLTLGALFVAPDAAAQSLSFNMGPGPTTTARIIQLVLLVTVLSLAPSILVMVTSYTRIIIVLSLLRSALGTQTTPPNIVLISLALFLTMFIMQPTFDQAWKNGVQPLMDNQITESVAFDRTLEPFRRFMLKNTRQKDLNLFMSIGQANAAQTQKGAAAETPAKMPSLWAETGKADNQNARVNEDEAEDISLRTIIPSFMISELRRAFEIGFLLFLPFLVIDMVVASVLMSMGMMMLPPSIISLPFKIIFFVLVDGWYLVSGSLLQSYGVS
ncbi:MAG: flagellar type III secretion system pore protein FliP [Alphaproteobacteria bacterium]|nr:flagellar type III secretion system pore protein FliP [Alphaproteobacteria bacterium]